MLVVEMLESVLDLRRRNGRDGTRYDGKIDGDMARCFHDRMLEDCVPTEQNDQVW